MNIYKKGMSIWIKAVFAIVLVIFVAFLIINIFSTKASTYQQKEHFDFYEQSSNLMMALLSNPYCINIASFSDESQSPAFGILDISKLDQLSGLNQDLWCVENYNFLYSIHIKDIENQRTWNLGLQNTEPAWDERSFTNSFPVAIRYNGSTTHLGILEFHLYAGEFPYFYGRIKQACLSQEPTRYDLDFRFDIDYNQDTNMMCIGRESEDTCFFPYFSCPVSSFNIPKGPNLVFIRHTGESVELV